MGLCCRVCGLLRVLQCRCVLVGIVGQPDKFRVQLFRVTEPVGKHIGDAAGILCGWLFVKRALRRYHLQRLVTVNPELTAKLRYILRQHVDAYDVTLVSAAKFF